MSSTVTSWLNRSTPTTFTVFATITAFCTYMCMYAFRKPFTAATFAEGPMIWGLDYKSALVIIQVLGYMLSKFIGIKVVSEMDSKKRAITILILIAIAWAALLGFALVPTPYNAIFLFFNGLPLGMIWGLVFAYLEGRNSTEVMGLGLCASFVFASGLVKDIGQFLMGQGMSEYWMPFGVGAIFALPLLAFTWLINQIPAPTAEDEALRTKREPMSGRERKQYFMKFATGIILLVLVYTILTAYRDFRDNFLADIWADLRGINNDVNFSSTETPVSILVLVALMLIVLVKDNFRALLVNHIAIGVGVIMAGVGTWFHQQGMLGDYTWIILTGLGTYLAYIPFNSILFDRLIATFRQVANVGFLIYVADAFGYMGSVGILIYKNFGAPNLSWLSFFTNISYVLAVIGAIGITLSILYFYWKKKRSTHHFIEKELTKG